MSGTVPPVVAGPVPSTKRTGTSRTASDGVGDERFARGTRSTSARCTPSERAAKAWVAMSGERRLDWLGSASVLASSVLASLVVTRRLASTSGRAAAISARGSVSAWASAARSSASSRGLEASSVWGSTSRRWLRPGLLEAPSDDASWEGGRRAVF